MVFVTAAIALGTSVVGALGLGATITGAFALGAIGFATQFALGFLMSALAPKPSSQTNNRGYDVNSFGSALDHQIIYGEVKTGGAVVYDNATGGNNKYLHRIIAFAGHEVDAFEEVYINDEFVEIGPAKNYVVTYTTKYKISRDEYAETIDTLNLQGLPVDYEIIAGVYSPLYIALAALLGIDLDDLLTEDQVQDMIANSLKVDGRITSGIFVSAAISSEEVVENQVLNKNYYGGVEIHEHLGSDIQEADPNLVARVGEWTTNHRLQGIAYLYVQLTFNSDMFPNGVPTITAVVRGKKVYDPRTLETVWSNNPALCTRDYLTSNSYGLGESSNNIDDIAFSVAADACDNLNYPTLTGGIKFTTNGAFTTAVTPFSFLNNIMSSMGGTVWYSQGKWRIKPAYYTAPVANFTDDDLRSGLSISTRHSRRDNFNTIKGTFKGTETNWQVTDYPEYTNAAFVTEDNGQSSVVDLDLPFTSSSVEARRIARIALERNRQQLTISASFGMKAFGLQVGDIITLTSTRRGWDAKEFEVTAWNFGITGENDLQVQLTLREISESVFDEVDDGVVYTTDNTSLPSIFDVENLGISAEVSLRVSKEKLTNVVVLNVTSSSSERIDHVEVQYIKIGDPSWKSSGTGQVGLFEIIDLDDGIYNFRARAVNTFGVKGAWEYLDGVSAEGLAQPPQDVTNFASSINGAVINLSWSAVTDLDLSYYRIRYTPNTATPSWANSINCTDKVPRPSTSVTVPALAGTFLIKAVDKSGIESVNETTLVVREVDLEPFNNTLTVTENPTFLGDKVGCIVEDNTLKIEIGLFATYDFDNYIDVGSVVRARVSVKSITSRFNSTSDLFDDLPNDLDSLPSLWDDLTGVGNFADTNVKAYVSYTVDDPAGSPTWTDYSPLVVADIYARAFRFKIALETDNSGITPTVVELSAKVQYN